MFLPVILPVIVPKALGTSRAAKISRLKNSRSFSVSVTLPASKVPGLIHQGKINSETVSKEGIRSFASLIC